MNLKPTYNFKEASLGPDFATEKLKEFRKLIDASISFVVMCMPGVGASYFLKYLSTTNLARFIHIDFYELPNLTQHEFYKLLLFRLGGKPGKESDDELFLKARSILHSLLQKHRKIVIIFNRFDQLKKEFDFNFLSNIQSLANLAPGSPRSAGGAGKIVAIFTSIKPMVEIAPEAVSGGNLTFYSKILYFKPYEREDLKKLLKLESEFIPKEVDLERLIELSGGHYQLLNILLNSQKKQLLLDQFVRQQMKALIDYLDYQQRKQVTSIASHPERLKGVEGSIDEYLLGVGMVKKTGTGFELFTPLLTEYIKSYFTPKLPPKEARLFNLLRKNIGKLVSKDEIFASIWESEPDKTTDWALDALIYRLRKHPFIKAHGYIIESQKKIGYLLIQT